ncbi:MAG TPA: TonB-dependent receptor [Polyangiaceae bacterium]
MARAKSASVAILAATLLAGAEARAEDVGNLLEVLEENVVTGASRSAERASEAPAMSSTITASELRRLGIKNLDDALNYLSAGMFAHSRMGTAEVGARGVALSRDSNSHVLVVLDGMVVNEQGGGAVFLHDIPMEVVDHIEVILGPGSVLYGAQAMLGVINVVTKTPRDYRGVHAATSFGMSPPLDVSGGVRAPDGFGSLGHDNRYSAGVADEFELFGQPGGALLSLDYADRKGPHMSFAEQPLPGVDLGPHAEPGKWGGPVYEQWYQRTLGTFGRLDLGDVSATTRITMTRLAMPQMDLFENRAPAAYDDLRNGNDYTLALANVRYQKRLTEHVSGMGRVYFGYSKRGNSRYVIDHDELPPGTPLGVIDPEQCPAGPLGPCRKEAYFYSRWLGLEVQSTYDWFADGAYTTMVGVDGRLRTAAYEFVTFDDRTGLSYGSDPAFTRWHAGGHDISDEQALGAYIQQTVRPFPYAALNAGVRADLDTRLGNDYTGDAISPRAALIVTPDPKLSVKLIYSTAFRAPSFLEQNIVNGRLLPNPDGLEPETVSSYEAMTTFKSDGHTLTFGGFYADWSNLIELQVVKAQAPAVSRFENVADVKTYGGNLGYEASLAENRLRLGLNSMVTASERQLTPEEQARNAQFGVGDTVPMTVAPRVYGNARAIYTFGKDTAVALAASYLGSRIADQAYYGGDPSNLSPRPEAPASLRLRAALTGSVLEGVGYTLGTDYSFASREPFVVGPRQGLPRYLSDVPNEAELSYVNRLTVFAGLEFHLDPEPAKPQSESAQTSAPKETLF